MSKLDNQVLIWLDDYAACLERMLESLSIAPTSAQYAVARSRRDRVMMYMANNATEQQLRAMVAGGFMLPATYKQEVAAAESASSRSIAEQIEGGGTGPGF